MVEESVSLDSSKVGKVPPFSWHALSLKWKIGSAFSGIILLLGILVVAIVYILTSLVFVYLVPLDQVTSGETFAAQAGEVLFGRAGGTIFSLIVVVAVLGSLAAVVMSAGMPVRPRSVSGGTWDS